MNAQHTPTVTKADRICAKGVRESLSAATGDMLVARHREQSQAELLEALEAMCAIVARHTYPCPDKPESNWAKLQDARAAIAKARGPSQ